MSLIKLDHLFASHRDQALAERGLPEMAFVDNRHDKSPNAPPVIGIRRGESGYHPIFTNRTAAQLNAMYGVTEAQRIAMQNGSLFGWEVPGAFPDHRIVQELASEEAALASHA